MNVFQKGNPEEKGNPEAMRHGEAAGRRWRHYDPGVQPLGCLEVGTQYEDLPLKTSEDF